MKFDRNFLTRSLSALVLIPAVLFVVWRGGPVFSALVLSAAVIMIYEWIRLTRTAKHRVLWWVGGIVYVTVPCMLLWRLRMSPMLFGGGFDEILFLLIIVWATDTGAYLAGKIIGGPRLAPYISPNKTWAGCYGGLLAAAIFGSTAAVNMGQPLILALAMSGTLSIVGQMGDLFKSWIKRLYHVKDTGAIIPGHGGLIDRLDSLLFVIPLFALEAWLLRLPQVSP